MKAWHGEASLKASAMERMREHRRLDEIIRGDGYWSEYGHRGCQLGCLTHTGVWHNKLDEHRPHRETERQFGIPATVARLLEHCFENLPVEDAADWAVDSLEAIPVGADLTTIQERMMEWAQETDPTITFMCGGPIAKLVECAIVARIHRNLDIRDVANHVLHLLRTSPIELDAPITPAREKSTTSASPVTAGRPA